jgi:outer membrane protein TolC
VAARDLIDPGQPVARMIASALRFRPETAGLRAEVAAAPRLKARKVSPFLPQLSVAYSNMDFGANSSGGTRDSGNREEIISLIYWRLEGLGFGDRAAAREKKAELKLARLEEAKMLDQIANDVSAARAEVTAQASRIPTSQQASQHARKAYQLTSERLSELQGLPIEALASIQTLAEARQAEIDAILDYNIAQHRHRPPAPPLTRRAVHRMRAKLLSAPGTGAFCLAEEREKERPAEVQKLADVTALRQILEP